MSARSPWTAVVIHHASPESLIEMSDQCGQRQRLPRPTPRTASSHTIERPRFASPIRGVHATAARAAHASRVRVPRRVPSGSGHTAQATTPTAPTAANHRAGRDGRVRSSSSSFCPDHRYREALSHRAGGLVDAHTRYLARFRARYQWERFRGGTSRGSAPFVFARRTRRPRTSSCPRACRRAVC